MKRTGAVSWMGLCASLFGAGCVTVGVVGLVAYVSDFVAKPAVVVASFVPYLLAVTAVGAIVSAIARRWVVLVLAVVVLAVGATTIVPLYVADGDPVGDGPSLVVMQANVMLGEADPTALVDVVRDRRVDVLTVEELTVESESAFTAAGLERILPFHTTAPGQNGSAVGAGIYSRFPISNDRRLDGYSFANLAADIDVHDVSTLVYVVHPLPPYPYTSSTWVAEMDRLREEMSGASSRDHVIVAGDFNATFGHSRFRRLMDTGFTDVASSLGSGILPTYPTDKQPLPAFLGIDHVLTRGVTPRSLDRVDIVGSDHKGLIAEMTLQ